jgi:hypothetical protein
MMPARGRAPILAGMSKTQARFERADAAPAGAAWTGWVVFASIMLAVVGLVNAFQGIAALVDDSYFIVGEDQLLVGDFTTWGVLMLLWGCAQLAAGVGLNSGRGWARDMAVAIAAVSILIQTAFLAAYPAWSVTIIALDVVIIYALTARWAEARAGL